MFSMRLKATPSLCFVLALISCVGLLADAIYANEQPSGVEVGSLLCEYKVKPIGMDELYPRLSWQLKTTRRAVSQSAYQVRVGARKEDLIQHRNLLWDSGKVKSDQSVNVVYTGPDLLSGKRYYWQVRVWDDEDQASDWSQLEFWEMGLLEPSDWKASWIIPNLDEDTSRPQAAPMLRTEFEIPEEVGSARLYITSLGLYEVEVNGRTVGDQIFTPGWTSYRNRLQYQTYEVQDLLRKGRNAVGIVLGDGWYRGFIGFKGQRNYYGDKLALLFQLDIAMKDGSSLLVLSNDTWTSSHGPILMSDIYMGESYDARLEQPGWSEPGFDDESWSGVRQQDFSKDHLIAPVGPPVRRQEEIKPVEILKTPDGKTVYDLGQNMVGWVRIQVHGEAGDVITLRHAEVLDQQGNLYTENLRSARQEVQYTLKGGEEEVYEPHFSFQGFRYVMVDGLRSQPALDHITGIVIHSEMAKTGRFKCSDPLLNQLQHNILWGQKGNFLDVPTDCPQRDERLGWTGDAQVFARTAAFNMDVASFFTKWLGDLAADQLEDGRIPHVVPNVIDGFASAAWADAGVIIPWTLYLTYGDERILQRQYRSMKAWVDHVTRAAGEDDLWNSGFHFGDWLAYNTTRSDYPGATTDKDLIATSFFAYSTDLIRRTALVLGKSEDAEYYSKLLVRIKRAFNDEFVTPNGRLSSNTQTAYVLALNFGLFPEAMRSIAADRLAQDVRAFDNHLTTGFVGTPYLCHVLSRFEHLETAYALLNQKSYPSWLYPVTKGATTIWERWDGIKPDGSFQDAGMNSFNHYAYGAIGDWMYRVVAGVEIDPEQPGYKNVLIQPSPGGGLDWVEASLQTLYGEVSSKWSFAKDRFRLAVGIPANAQATVRLPGAQLEDVSVDGKSPAESVGIHSVSQTRNAVLVAIGSGNYEFSYPAPTSAQLE